MEKSLPQWRDCLIVAFAIILCARIAVAADSSLAPWPEKSKPSSDAPDPSTAPSEKPNQVFGSLFDADAKPADCWSCNPLPAPVDNSSAYNTGPPSDWWPIQTSWYTRVDYYRWNERLHGANFVNESGPLYTIGYTRYGDDRRFRAEVFAGRVDYAGGIQFPDGSSIPLFSHTDYVGGRAEYDLFFLPRNCPNIQILLGLGLRVSNRNLPSTTISPNILVQGYQETWFTLYPYIGVETRHDPCKQYEFYGRGRLGLTAFTYEYVTIDPRTGLYPRCGVTALLEEGIRIEHLSLTGYIEIFGWAPSGVHNNFMQPMSTLLTIGAQAGFRY